MPLLNQSKNNVMIPSLKLTWNSQTKSDSALRISLVSTDLDHSASAYTWIDFQPVRRWVIYMTAAIGKDGYLCKLHHKWIKTRLLHAKWIYVRLLFTNEPGKHLQISFVQHAEIVNSRPLFLNQTHSHGNQVNREQWTSWDVAAEPRLSCSL